VKRKELDRSDGQFNLLMAGIDANFFILLSYLGIIIYLLGMVPEQKQMFFVVVGIFVGLLGAVGAIRSLMDFKKIGKEWGIVK